MEKKNMNSFVMQLPRKDPIPNQDINRLGIKKYQSIPLKSAKHFPGYKSLLNEEENGCNDSTDTSHNNKEDHVDNLKEINNKNIDFFQIVYMIFFIVM